MSDQPKKKAPHELRSQQWFGRQDRDGFAYRSWVKGKGVPHDQFDGRPVIGICNTFSELTPCNSHFRTLAEQVKIGVYEAGGFPLEFPVMSLGEPCCGPPPCCTATWPAWTSKKASAATRSTAWCC
jgi:L-arabonate dehydrase